MSISELNFSSVLEDKLADITYCDISHTAIITTKSEYLPMDSFRELFSKLADFMKAQPVKKLIFDKRSLKVFHQPSMEWYYLEWKTVMLDKYGLRHHYKILPKDSLFRKSVEIGRNKILSNAQENSPLLQLNILYFESLDEALKA